MLVMTDAQRRQSSALVLSPLTPSVLILAIALTGLMGRVEEAIWVCVMLIPFSYLTLFFPGLLLYRLIQKLHWHSVWVYIAVGFLCGCFASALVYSGSIAIKVANGALAAWATLFNFSVITASFGCVTGLVFWMIARPDRGEGNEKHIRLD